MTAKSKIAGLVLATALAGLPAAVHSKDSGSKDSIVHLLRTAEGRVPYTAVAEEFLVRDGSGKNGASLVATSYIRSDVAAPGKRPVIFLFNGGPSAAAIGVHEQFGPLSDCSVENSVRICDNPNSLIGVADLVMFDPAETGYSRVLPEGDRDFFYSTEGDAEALAQLVAAWLEKHDRRTSPVYLLGESYGSIRQVVAADRLAAKSIAISGHIILGNSIFLMETSRRTNNIISTAVSLPLLAITAAYHGKADKRGQSDGAFLDEVYRFAMTDYLSALAKGHDATPDERRQIADRLEAYTGISAAYYLDHDLAIAKHVFNKMLLPGQALDRNDSRIKSPVARVGPGPERADPLFAKEQRFYVKLMREKIGAAYADRGYQPYAPQSFERWDWGAGCSDYVGSAGLCNAKYGKRTIFVDYDWQAMLKRQLEKPGTRAIILSGYYDGLSSVGTHRYLRAQLGLAPDKLQLREYPAGHMTAGDPKAQPDVMNDVKNFLAAK